MKPIRKIRVIKPNENDRDYVRDHEKSLIALLVPEHIEYTRQVIEKVRRSEVRKIEEPQTA